MLRTLMKICGSDQYRTRVGPTPPFFWPGPAFTNGPSGLGPRSKGLRPHTPVAGDLDLKAFRRGRFTKTDAPAPHHADRRSPNVGSPAAEFAAGMEFGEHPPSTPDNPVFFSVSHPGCRVRCR